CSSTVGLALDTPAKGTGPGEFSDHADTAIRSREHSAIYRTTHNLQSRLLAINADCAHMDEATRRYGHLIGPVVFAEVKAAATGPVDIDASSCARAHIAPQGKVSTSGHNAESYCGRRRTTSRTANQYVRPVPPDGQPGCQRGCPDAYI